VHNSVNYVGKCQILHFRENFRYFRTFSQENFREKRKKIFAKISRKCENENFRFNPSAAAGGGALKYSVVVPNVYSRHRCFRMRLELQYRM
jgi:hypothetical protein